MSCPAGQCVPRDSALPQLRRVAELSRPGLVAVNWVGVNALEACRAIFGVAVIAVGACVLATVGVCGVAAGRAAVAGTAGTV